MKIEDFEDKAKNVAKNASENMNDKIFEEIEMLKKKLLDSEDKIKELKGKADIIVKEHPYSVALGSFIFGLLSVVFFRCCLKKTH